MDPSFTPARVLKQLQSTGAFDNLVLQAMKELQASQDYVRLREETMRVVRKSAYLSTVDDSGMVVASNPRMQRKQLVQALRGEASQGPLRRMIEDSVFRLIGNNQSQLSSRVRETVESVVDELALQDQEKMESASAAAATASASGQAAQEEGGRRSNNRLSSLSIPSDRGQGAIVSGSAAGGGRESSDTPNSTGVSRRRLFEGQRGSMAEAQAVDTASPSIRTMGRTEREGSHSSTGSIRSPSKFESDSRWDVLSLPNLLKTGLVIPWSSVYYTPDAKRPDLSVKAVLLSRINRSGYITVRHDEKTRNFGYVSVLLRHFWDRSVLPVPTSSEGKSEKLLTPEQALDRYSGGMKLLWFRRPSDETLRLLNKTSRPVSAPDPEVERFGLGPYPGDKDERPLYVSMWDLYEQHMAAIEQEEMLARAARRKSRSSSVKSHESSGSVDQNVVEMEDEEEETTTNPADVENESATETQAVARRTETAEHLVHNSKYDEEVPTSRSTVSQEPSRSPPNRRASRVRSRASMEQAETVVEAQPVEEKTTVEPLVPSDDVAGEEPEEGEGGDARYPRRVRRKKRFDD